MIRPQARSTLNDVAGGGFLSFICPKGRHCGVAVATDPKREPRPFGLPQGKVWEWDGNSDKPTVKPSINCGGCGWHGFITAGVLIDAS